ncbi:MAG: hypothetical protein ACXWL8_05760, partial [Candidatus Limnocylindria bacterium]
MPADGDGDGARPGLRLTAAVVGALAIAAALVAAWLEPPLAAAFVWPVLFVLPGWAIIGWA